MSVLLALAMQAATQPSPSVGKLSQVRLDAMSDACHAPRTWLQLHGRGVVFAGDPEADHAKTECVLHKVSATVALTDIAFVGNAPASED